LDDILGFAVVPHDGAGDAKEPAIVVSDNGPDRGLLALAGAGNEVGLGGGSDVDLLFRHGPYSVRLAIGRTKGPKVPNFV